MFSSSVASPYSASLHMPATPYQGPGTVETPYLVGEIAAKAKKDKYYAPNTPAAETDLVSKMVSAQDHKRDIAHALSIPTYSLVSEMFHKAVRASAAPQLKLCAKL